MKLEEGRLYNVSGRHIYGAGSTKERATEFWRDIMYVQDEHVHYRNVHVFLADGDQHRGSIDREILTRVKIQKGKFRLVGNNVITNNILDKTTICMPPGEHPESVDRCLRKAESLAEKLPQEEKRERYLAMIRYSLYEEYKEERRGNLVIVTKKDPVLRDLMHKAFG